MQAEVEKGVAFLQMIINRVVEFGESSMNLGVRYWVPTRQFFPLSYATNLAIWKTLRGAGITMPFPQRNVRIVSQPDAVR